MGGLSLREKSGGGSAVGGGELGGGDSGIASVEVESVGMDGEVGEEGWFEEDDDVDGCGDLGELGVRAFEFVKVVVEVLLKAFRLGLSFCLLSSLAFRWHAVLLSWLLEHLPRWIHWHDVQARSDLRHPQVGPQGFALHTQHFCSLPC